MHHFFFLLRGVSLGLLELELGSVGGVVVQVADRFVDIQRSQILMVLVCEGYKIILAPLAHCFTAYHTA